MRGLVLRGRRGSEEDVRKLASGSKQVREAGAKPPSWTPSTEEQHPVMSRLHCISSINYSRLPQRLAPQHVYMILCKAREAFNQITFKKVPLTKPPSIVLGY